MFIAIELYANILHTVAMATQAVATRDAMAKALYGALFDWIVDQVSCHQWDGLFGHLKLYQLLYFRNINVQLFYISDSQYFKPIQIIVEYISYKMILYWSYSFLIDFNLPIL